MTLRTLTLALCATAALTACGDDDPVVTPGNDTGTADAGTTDTSMDDASMDDTSMDDTSMDDASMDDTTDTAAADPTLAEVHAAVFAPSCGGLGCHLNGDAAGQINLDLNDGLLDRLLGSSSVRGVNQIEPGDPSASYLYLKITGEHFDVGGSGGRMPLSRAPISDEAQQLLADWITAGAPE